MGHNHAIKQITQAIKLELFYEHTFITSRTVYALGTTW